MKKKKSQAAMEFLMTYGWAMMVAMVIISTMAYFGVLNPQQFLPRKCVFQTGIICADHLVSSEDNSVTFRLNNGLGADIQIERILVADKARFVSCYEDDFSESYLPAGKERNFRLEDCGDLDEIPGVRIKADATITYVNQLTQFKHTASGQLITDVE